MIKSFVTILFVVLSLAIFTPAQAVTTYKWMDTDGSVHYTQQPPAEGVPYEKIQTLAPSRNSRGTSAATSAARNSILEDKADKDKNALVEKEMAKNEEARQKNCDIAKERLTFFQVQRRWKDKDGNVQSLTEEERKAKLEEAKQHVKDFCD